MNKFLASNGLISVASSERTKQTFQKNQFQAYAYPKNNGIMVGYIFYDDTCSIKKQVLFISHSRKLSSCLVSFVPRKALIDRA
jgi:hypothetical protein